MHTAGRPYAHGHLLCTRPTAVCIDTPMLCIRPHSTQFPLASLLEAFSHFLFLLLFRDWDLPVPLGQPRTLAARGIQIHQHLHSFAYISFRNNAFRATFCSLESCRELTFFCTALNGMLYTIAVQHSAIQLQSLQFL